MGASAQQCLAFEETLYNMDGTCTFLSNWEIKMPVNLAFNKTTIFKNKQCVPNIDKCYCQCISAGCKQKMEQLHDLKPKKHAMCVVALAPTKHSNTRRCSTLLLRNNKVSQRHQSSLKSNFLQRRGSKEASIIDWRFATGRNLAVLDRSESSSASPIIKQIVASPTTEHIDNAMVQAHSNQRC
jgi:hypothetical protein